MTVRRHLLNCVEFMMLSKGTHRAKSWAHTRARPGPSQGAHVGQARGQSWSSRGHTRARQAGGTHGPGRLDHVKYNGKFKPGDSPILVMPYWEEVD